MCRQTDIERRQSKKQLKKLLQVYVRPETIVYIADQNPSAPSTSQPELVSAFIKDLFEDTYWEKIAFYEFDRDLLKLQKQHGRRGPFYNELRTSDCFETYVQPTSYHEIH